MKIEKKKQPSPQGIRISPALHELMTKASTVLNLGIGEAYAAAAVDWLKKNGGSPTGGNAIVRSLIDEACGKNHEIRVLFSRSISKAS